MKLFDHRIRGFRLVDLIAAALLAALVLGVYLAKTMAGRERAQIASADRQIGDEKQRIRLLTAEVAYLEKPARLERLSETYLGMGPVSIQHDVTPEELADIVRSARLTGKPPGEAKPRPEPAPLAFDPTRPPAPEVAER